MRYSGVTTASVSDVQQLARAAFGPQGAGLRQTAVSLTEATFSGPLGEVTVVVNPLGRGLNEVVVASQAFDREAAQFVRDLPRETAARQLWRRLRAKIAPKIKP
jgi:hypothetical protein